MLRNTDPTTPDIRELLLKTSALQRELKSLQGEVASTNRNVDSLLFTRSTVPAAPVANLLWNGEIGHSQNSWHDGAYVTTDKAKEAAWWYSHTAPTTVLTFTAADVNIGTDTIAATAHGRSRGERVRMSVTGVDVLPTPLNSLTPYYVIPVDANSFKLASSLANAYAGTAIDLTATGTGTFYVRQKLDNNWTGAPTTGSSINQTLKKADQTYYNPMFGRWNATNGWAELTGTQTVDQVLPTNHIDATTPLARVSLIAAKKSQYIEIPDDALLAAGVWDDTLLQQKFLEGDIGLTAEVVGTPASTTARFYRVLLTSDRGYSLLSSEVSVPAAPADGAYTVTDYVSLAWRQQAGQLQVDIYERTGASYRLIQQVSAANGYIHLGSYLEDVAGYPTPTGTLRTGTFYTLEGELPGLAINGVSPSWSTINFPIQVPNNYNKANTTDRQWVRIWSTVAANLLIPGVTTAGTTTLTLPSGIIDSSAFSAGGYGTGANPYTTGAAGQSAYVGLTIEVYDSAGALLATETIASVVSDTSITISGSGIAAGSDREIRIVGGGFHGIYLDKIHLGFQENTSYVPNAADVRVLQPVAAPSSSSQGTVGGGGTGGGINNCVVGDTPIKLADGTWGPMQLRQPGELWSAGAVRPNIFTSNRIGWAQPRTVKAANGCRIRCTDSERFVTHAGDLSGTPLFALRVGDTVVTEVDGRIEPSKLVYIGPHEPMERVFTPTLSETHLFIAGAVVEPKWRSWLRSKLSFLPLPARRTGGFVLHNNKPYIE